MKKFLILLLILVSMVAGKAAAQDEKVVLNLRQCLDLAKDRSQELRAEQDRVTQSRERLKQARGLSFPSINLNYSTLFQDTAGGQNDGQDTNSGLSLIQPLYYGSRITDGVALSKADIAREEANYRTLLRGLNRNITGAFYTVVSFQKDIENLENTIGIMRSRYQELKERERLGKSRESELLAVESQIATLAGQQAQAEAARISAAESLARLLGVDSTKLILSDDAGPVENLPVLQTYIESVQNRSDIESARASSLIQEKTVGIAKSYRLPVVNLQGDWYLMRSGSLSDSKWDATILASVPLFQGGVLRGRIDEQLARKREIDEALSALIRDTVSEVKQLYQSVVFSMKQSQAYTDAFDKAEKSYKLQMKDYRFGLVNNLDVIQATLDMLSAKRSLDTTNIQVKSNRELLEIAVQN
jgi:outer membrane protein